MSEQMMAELLDRVVPVELGRPDWDDVRARANLRDQRDARPRRRTFRRPRYIVLAAALALAVLLVTPAFGVRDLLVDLVTREDQDFGGASIAPTVVQRNFHEMTAGAPEGMDPQVLPLQTRLVAQIRYEGRERNLWVAPTARGGFCFQIENGHGGCQRNGGYLPPIATTIAAFQKPGSETTEIRNVGGTVTDPRITTLLVEFGDGLRVPVRFTYVSAPIEAGFFSYDVPRNRSIGKLRPVAVVGLNGDGEDVWRDDSPSRIG
jgi:hypothetical protein